MVSKRGIIPLICIVVVALSGMLTACSGQSIQINQPAGVTKDIRAVSGGSISDTHGATLTIAPNALSGDAHVTLADTGQPSQAKGDPLDYISDSFTVTATPLTGTTKITLAQPATMQITTHPTKKGQDIIVAEQLSDSVGAIHLHYALGAKGSLISAQYSQLGASEWGVFLPLLLNQPTPTEGNVLQVPWYDQSGVGWCTPTALSEMLRYYDFNENAGDPLNATFGPTTALANWEIAAQSHQSASGGAAFDESKNIGLPSYFHSDPGGTAPRLMIYLWDDDFFFTVPGDSSTAVQDQNHLDFQNYVVLINTGSLGFAERKPVGIMVDALYHSLVIVGVDSKGVFLHDSNGGIAVHRDWVDLFNQAHLYRTDAAGKPDEVHSIWTGVVYNLPVKPLEKREGSVVIKRNDLSFADSANNRVTLDWDGIGTHTAGYFFNDSSDTTANGNSHGTAAFRNLPLHYSYRVANVSNIALTFHTVAELSGASYGAGIIRQGHDVTVPPYAESNDITGSFPAFPAGASAIFDVRLVETNDATINQDVKFIRIDLRNTLFNTPSAPVVHITTPAPNSHVTANVPFRLAGSVNEPTGENLSNTFILWSVNGTPLASGTAVTTTLTKPGIYTINLSATDAFLQMGSDTLTLIVDPPTPKPVPTATLTPRPTVSILDPTNGQTFYGVTSVGQSLTLSGTGLAGVTNYSWSDSIAGDLGTGKLLTITLYLPRETNCGASVAHVITLTGSDSSGQKATSQVNVTLVPQCIH